MTRPFNFSPGPAVVAPEVLEAAAEALRGVPEVGGLSVVEISHRLPWFEQVVADTRDALRRLMAIPDSHALAPRDGSQSANRRSSTTNTSCIASSTDETGTPNRRSAPRRVPRCSRYTRSIGSRSGMAWTVPVIA